MYVNKLDPATGAIISKTPTNLRLEASFSIAFDNLGRLWIATAGEGPHGRLFAIDPTTGKGVAPLVPILDGSRSIAIDPETQVMYNVHAGYGQLPNAFTTIDPSTGAETAIAILPFWVAISLVPEPLSSPAREARSHDQPGFPFPRTGS